MAHNFRGGLSGEEPPTNARVRRALNLLKPVLEAFVRQTLAPLPGARVPGDADLQGLLRAMLDNQGAFFAGRSGEALKHHVHLLRGARNWNAHDVVLDEREAHQIILTVAIVAERIGAPRELVEAVDALNAVSRPPSAPPTATSGGQVPPPPRPPRNLSGSASGGSSDRGPSWRGPTRDAATGTPGPVTGSGGTPGLGPARVEVRRSDDGIILNAEELTADDVVMQRVLCPGCRTKVFEEWSAGWDAHAAHRCGGMTADSPEERKCEFRRRFSHLFRGGEGQRVVMRCIWRRCCPDQERAIGEYADAERRGEVRRASNAHGVSPEAYARALLADGLRKGWLQPCG